MMASSSDHVIPELDDARGLAWTLTLSTDSEGRGPGGRGHGRALAIISDVAQCGRGHAAVAAPARSL